VSEKTNSWNLMDSAPEGYRKIEAYTNGKELIALEWPVMNDENHDCDKLGCATFSHVKYRVKIPEWQAKQLPSESVDD